MIKKILLFLCILLTPACAQNKNVNTVVESTTEVIDKFVELKPECKDMGAVCKEQIKVVNEICQQEIKEERSCAWKTGFFYGCLSVLLLFVTLVVISKRIFK